jgi:hypothetical protein
MSLESWSCMRSVVTRAGPAVRPIVSRAVWYAPVVSVSKSVWPVGAYP